MKRIEILDSLRGFALLLILLYHSFYNFGAVYTGESTFLALPGLDNIASEFVFHFVADRAFAVFSVIFGISFFIQLNKKSDGDKFLISFVRRLIVLLFIGYMHSILFRGDILMKYAVIGFLLLPLNKLNNKLLTIIAIIFLVQIPDIYLLMQSGYGQITQSIDGNDTVWNEIITVSRDGSFHELLALNMWTGMKEVWKANIENGRLSFITGFFVIGLLIGRKFISGNFKMNRVFMIRTFIISSALYIALGLLGNNLSLFSPNSAESYEILSGLIKKYMSICMTFSLITFFVIINELHIIKRKMDYLIPYGRMGLTTYLTHSLIGVPVFYGFGLAMYNYAAPFFSILVGVAIFAVQMVFSHLWFRHYAYGPAEWVWRSITYPDRKIPFKQKG